MNKNLIKDALVLTLITLVAGCLLGLVQMVTADPIKKQNEKIKQEAYQKVFPEAKSFHEAEGVNLKDAENVLKLAKAGLEKNTIDEVLAASSDGSDTIGYVMTITNAEAYDGKLTLTMGIANDGTVKGIAFTDLSETAGLGMKADEDEFKNQFKDKQVDAFAYTKSGASSENEIDALSGATITTNAVTNGVNAGITFFKSFAGGGSDE